MATLARPAQLLLARAYVARVEFIRRVLGSAAAAAYEDMDPFAQDDVDEYVDRLMALSGPAQRALVTSLAGYLSVVSDEGYPDWDADEFSGDEVVPDVGEERTWRIPFFSFWGALGAGLGVDLAREALASDLGRTAQSLLSFSQANAMASMAGQLNLGYQRVRAGEGCEFCNEEPDHVYTDDPMPLHIGCRCSVMAVPKGG